MKKLMIAAAIVCAAAFAHAASVDWTYSGYFEDVNGELAEGTVEILFNDTSLGVFDMVNGEVSQVVSIDDGGGTIKAIANIDNFADGAGTIEYTYTYTSLPFAGDPNVGASLSKLNGYVSYALTNGESLDLSTSAADNGFSPVPEPTSGLLLLIGVAGLALRRKRV